MQVAGRTKARREHVTGNRYRPSREHWLTTRPDSAFAPGLARCAGRDVTVAARARAAFLRTLIDKRRRPNGAGGCSECRRAGGRGSSDTANVAGARAGGSQPVASSIQPERQLITGRFTRAQRGQPRSSVSDSDATRTPSSRPQRQGVRLDVFDHQLGSAKHGKAVAGSDVAPREVEEPLALPAVHSRSAQVRSAVRDNSAHVHLPARPVGVARHQADGLFADLDGDVHVVQWYAVRHELGSRQVMTLDDDSHRCPVWRRTRCARGLTTYASRRSRAPTGGVVAGRSRTPSRPRSVRPPCSRLRGLGVSRNRHTDRHDGHSTAHRR